MARKKIMTEETSEEKGVSGSIRLGEFGSAVLQLAEEKGISEEKVIEVVEAALAAAYKKDYGKRGQVIRAEFDRETKTAKYFLVKEIVDETVREFVDTDESEDELEPEEAPKRKRSKVREEEIIPMPTIGEDGEERLPRYNAERDIILEEARKIASDAIVGDTVDLPLEPYQEFGRVAAQTAKQVIIQRIREAERESMFAEYKGKEGTVVNGTVQRVEGRVVYVDLGKSVGALFPAEQMEGENYRIGQRLKVYLVRVDADAKGPGITLSRAHAEMVRHLFTLEVPEIFAGTVVIKAIAREAGSRTKIAVWTGEEGVDPIGSCVGQKGTRVQTVIDELGGEKIDIIEWSDDKERCIKAALSPAKVATVEIDEEAGTALVQVPEDQLSLAIGRRGQNVRLASKLVGMRIDIAGSDSRRRQAGESPEDEASSDAKMEDVRDDSDEFVKKDDTTNEAMAETEASEEKA